MKIQTCINLLLVSIIGVQIQSGPEKREKPLNFVTNDGMNQVLITPTAIVIGNEKEKRMCVIYADGIIIGKIGGSARWYQDTGDSDITAKFNQMVAERLLENN